MVIWLIAVKIKLVVNKIINAIVIVKFKNSAILFTPSDINIYMVYIFHLFFKVFANTFIKRQNNSCIYILFS